LIFFGKISKNKPFPKKMSSCRKWRYKCNTENTLVYETTTGSTPTTCINNASHSIDATSLTLLESEALVDVSTVPTTTTDNSKGYKVTDIVQHDATNNLYICTQSTPSAATWASLTNIPHSTLTEIGTNTHAQIDTHIANVNNPHSVTKAQVGLSNVLNLLNNVSATTAPTTSDNSTIGYGNGSTWLNINNGYYYVCTNASEGTWFRVSPVENYVLLDEKAVSSAGGGYGTANSWQKRKLTVIKPNVVGSSVTLDTSGGANDSLFTLQPGTYCIDVSTPMQLGIFKSRLVTDANVLVEMGSAQRSSNTVPGRSFISTTITVTTATAYQIQVACTTLGAGATSTTSTNLGQAVGISSTEIYTIVKIQRIG
jgi:hypothetical protein